MAMFQQMDLQQAKLEEVGMSIDPSMLGATLPLRWLHWLYSAALLCTTADSVGLSVCETAFADIDQFSIWWCLLSLSQVNYSRQTASIET